MASLKGMTEEEKRLRKRKQLNEAQRRYYQKHKEYYKNYSKDFYKKKYRELEERIAKAVEYINKNKKVVSKYEAKDTRLPLDTFMWGVDNLLNILQEGEE